MCKFFFAPRGFTLKFRSWYLEDVMLFFQFSKTFNQRALMIVIQFTKHAGELLLLYSLRGDQCGSMTIIRGYQN